MAKDPAVLFYTSDFLTGTTFFTYEQKGQYITLLCQQHQLGMIPEGHMTNICKDLTSPVVQKFVRTADGFYYNVRMKEEAEKRSSYCNSRRNNIEGVNQHTKKTGHTTSHTSPRMENENENENKDVLNKEKRAHFDDLWGKYPRKLGLKASLKHYMASVLTDQDRSDIDNALGCYLNTRAVRAGDSKYIQYGSTWFNNWRDYINYVEPKTEKEKRDEYDRSIFRDPYDAKR